LLGGIKMNSIEYSTKQMIAYFIVASERITDYKDKLLSNYIKELKIELENTSEKYILNRVNVSKFAFFVIKHSLNVDEIFYYAVVVFNRLLNYYHREFKEDDIIKEVEIVMTTYSARTIITEAKKVLSQNKCNI